VVVYGLPVILGMTLDAQQIEKFKACEKAVKKKAFSNVALVEAVKFDPKELEMLEAVEWLDTQLEKLQIQVEQAEAEIKSLEGVTKKKVKAGSSAAGRLEYLKHFNVRRRWHISRLEIVSRLLNNGWLETKNCLALKDDVHYFVECNAVCRVLYVLDWQLTAAIRKRTSQNTKECTTTSISTRKRKSSGVTDLKLLWKVRTASTSTAHSSLYARTLASSTDQESFRRQ
jgi:hypothetical protein